MDTVLTGWLLDERDRAGLLERFEPAYPDLVAHHVTLGSDGDASLPIETAGEVVGEADDGAGVQALVVRIGGTTDRPDGSTYHITWSLDRAAGRTPVESNGAIRDHGWRAVETPIPVRLIPSPL